MPALDDRLPRRHERDLADVPAGATSGSGVDQVLEVVLRPRREPAAAAV